MCRQYRLRVRPYDRVQANVSARVGHKVSREAKHFGDSDFPLSLALIDCDLTSPEHGLFGYLPHVCFLVTAEEPLTSAIGSLADRQLCAQSRPLRQAKSNPESRRSAYQLDRAIYRACEIMVWWQRRNQLIIRATIIAGFREPTVAARSPKRSASMPRSTRRIASRPIGQRYRVAPYFTHIVLISCARRKQW